MTVSCIAVSEVAWVTQEEQIEAVKKNFAAASKPTEKKAEKAAAKTEKAALKAEEKTEKIAEKAEEKVSE